MKVVGLIAEYNPFHNGHKYQLDKIKEMYPDSLVVLVLNGYFMQRGEISYVPKYTKVKESLEQGIDLVLELPLLYGTQSGDIFAYEAVRILNEVHVDTLVFGSESNDLETLKRLATYQEDAKYQELVKNYLDQGLNYPTALAKALPIEFSCTPNDLLGVSYLKAILKINPSIEAVSIKRTSDYHDIDSHSSIVSASNIRNKFLKEDISFYTPYPNDLLLPNYEVYFQILKTKILTDTELSNYMDVTEGLEAKLRKEITTSYSLEDFLSKCKTKRYTYNRLNRMFIHILLGISKNIERPLYKRVLGFNKLGKSYLKEIHFEENYKHSEVYRMELVGSQVYDILMGTHTYPKEIHNQPIVISQNDAIIPNGDTNDTNH